MADIEIASWDRPWQFDGKPWKDGNVYYGCDEGGLVIHADANPTLICFEDGDGVCIPKGWAETPAKAKHYALHCDGGLDGAWWPDLRVRTVWMRCQDEWEDGEIGYAFDGAGTTWWYVDAGDEHAHQFWQVTEKRRG